MSDMNIAQRLRGEANASEELHPGDSDVVVMREAADAIENLWRDRDQLRIENRRLRETIGNFYNQEMPAAMASIEDAVHIARKSMRAKVRALLSDTSPTGAEQ